MRIGIHVRTAGGYAAAVEHARDAGCTALQVFSSNPRTYRVTAVDEASLQEFARMRRDADLDPCAIHTAYLVNLASDDPKIASGSERLLRADLEVARLGGMRYVNTHLGSYGERDRDDGFRAICAALERCLENIAPGVFLVLENSAGAGNLAGGTLPELGAIVRAVGHPQLGICLDTAHAWAAGYRIDSAENVGRFVEEAEREVGVDKILMFHFNDTQVELGAARDRHWHIGDGKIGLDGFRALIAHPELRDKTAILETPGSDADDVRNVQTVLALERGAIRARAASV
ncbi:MAG TPA: deoxyribonuclease IV [Candidatus Tumulicola sp.]